MTEVEARATSCCRRHGAGLYLTDMSREATQVQDLLEAEEEFLNALHEQEHHQPAENDNDFSDEEDIRFGIYIYPKVLSNLQMRLFLS